MNTITKSERCLSIPPHPTEMPPPRHPPPDGAAPQPAPHRTSAPWARTSPYRHLSSPYRTVPVPLQPGCPTKSAAPHRPTCPRCRRSTAAPRGGCLVPSLPAAPWPQRAATGPQQCLVRLKKGRMCRRPFLVRASGSWGNPPAPLRGGLVLAGGGRAAPKMAAPCPCSRWLLGGGVVLLKSWRYLRFMA